MRTPRCVGRWPSSLSRVPRLLRARLMAEPAFEDIAGFRMLSSFTTNLEVRNIPHINNISQAFVPDVV